MVTRLSPDQLETVDAAVMRAIASGRRDFMLILKHVTDGLRHAQLPASADLSRVVDRRLQALKKQRKIRYDQVMRGWFETR